MINIYRRILCGSLLFTTGIFIFYNYGKKTTDSYIVSPFVHERRNIVVGNLSKLSTKTTFIRIKETFFTMYKKYRRQKKQISGKGLSLLETTQHLRLSCSLDLFLLILVPSQANSMLNRIAMRLSWAHNFKPSKERNISSNFMYQVVFVINEHSEAKRTLKKESKKFGDILRVSHASLTIIPAVDRLLSRKCDPKYLLVLGNDTTYVNVPELAAWLSKLDSTVQYTGHIKESRAIAVENLSSTPNKIQKLVPCCVGRAYVLAGNVLKKLAIARRVVPLSAHNANEAMYVSTLTNFLGIQPHHDDRFKSRSFDDLNISDINPCTLKQEVFIHDVFRVRHILLYTKMIIVGQQPCANIW